MQIKNSALGRLAVRCFGEGRARKYAIEVDTDYADAFELPGTAICDSWENQDGSVVFVVESRTGIASVTQTLKGVRGVSRL
jgi:hypothetical protein